MSRRDRRRGAALMAGAAAALWAASLPSGTTYAAFSDFATTLGAAGAGVWLTDGDPPLPAECARIVFDRIIVGTQHDDVLSGTEGNDLIFGLQGKDVLRGLGGDDCLVGGNGKDELYGGDGDDVLIGGNAKDVLDGGSGSNTLNGGNGKDLLDGGPGLNVLLDGVDTTSTTEATDSELLLSPSDEPETTVLQSATSPDSDLDGESVEGTTEEPSLEPEPEPLTADGTSVEAPPEAPSADLSATEEKS